MLSQIWRRFWWLLRARNVCFSFVIFHASILPCFHSDWRGVNLADDADPCGHTGLHSIAAGWSPRARSGASMCVLYRVPTEPGHNAAAAKKVDVHRVRGQPCISYSSEVPPANTCNCDSGMPRNNSDSMLHARSFPTVGVLRRPPRSCRRYTVFSFFGTA